MTKYRKIIQSSHAKYEWISYNQTRNSNNSNKCVQRAPYLHGMDCISKYIEVKIKDKVANIRCPSKNYEQFLDPLFAGKSYQNHCLMSCVIFYAS